MKEFIDPYTTKEKFIRMVWNLSWFFLAKPFPKSLASPWKRLLLRFFGAKISKTSIVHSSAKIFMPWNLEMLEYSCIGPNTDIYNTAKITLGKSSTVSQRAYLCTASHNISSIKHEQIEKPIVIADRAWVAADAFIGPGVTIGEGAVVGARAVVFKNVEPWTVVGGNPAKFIKKRIIKNE